MATPFTEIPPGSIATIHSRFDDLIARRTRRVKADRTPAVRYARASHAERLSTFGSGRSAIRIGIAHTSEHLAGANTLVRKRYAWRGYEVQSQDDASTGTAPSRPETHEVTFVAVDDGATIGTITLGLDGPHGLRADETHGEAVSRLRAKGRRVCELTRLAVDERADSRGVLASLFSLVYTTARTIHDVTDVFIEVNPRHVAFYCRLLGFVVAAAERFCERVRAPSVLLHLDVDGLEERLRILGLGMIAPPELAAAA